MTSARATAQPLVAGCCGVVPAARLVAAAAADPLADWREACVAVRRAYARWAGAPAAGRRRAFRDFQLALESEQEASRIYAELLVEHPRSVGAQDPACRDVEQVDVR